MSSSINRHGRDLALSILRALPRVSLANLKNNAERKYKRGRGQHGGDFSGGGNRRKVVLPVGYDCSTRPFYKRFGYEPYYEGIHLRRQYPPFSLLNLQKLIDLNRLDPKKPIDLTAIVNTGIYKIQPQHMHYGIHLTDEGADIFQAKVNIEVQWASEPVIAAIERNGGMITTAYFDLHSVYAAINPVQFFKKGEPIPRRLLPPLDCLEYYSSAASRGYLADPDEVSKERIVLAQKYGYEAPKIEEDPDYKWLSFQKDPRQIFYGLNPGWVISLKDKVILKPRAEYLKEFYRS